MLEENNMNMIENNNNNINSFSKLISNISDLDNNKPNLMPDNYQFYFDNLQVTKKGNFIEDFNKIYKNKINKNKNESKFYNSSTNQSSNYIKSKNEKINPLKSPDSLNQNIKYKIDYDINLKNDKQTSEKIKKKDNKLESSCCNIF